MPRRRTLISYAATVTFLKIVLPAFAIALILAVGFWPRFLLDGGRFEIVTNDAAEVEIDRLSMINPRFEGIDSRQRSFTISAERAVQDLTNADLVLLTRPKAEKIFEDGAWVTLKAEQGFYDRNSEILDLAGGVHLYRQGGYEIHTPSAAIDLDNETAEGHEPVRALGPFGELTSEGFRVVERDALVVFTGKSRLRLVDGVSAPP